MKHKWIVVLIVVVCLVVGGVLAQSLLTSSPFDEVTTSAQGAGPFDGADATGAVGPSEP